MKKIILFTILIILSMATMVFATADETATAEAILSQTPTPSITQTSTITPTITATPTRVISYSYSTQNILNTERKGSYTSTSTTVYVHNWNKSPDSYEAFAEEATGNTYTFVRKLKQTNDVIFWLSDLSGNTITGDFDFSIKQ
jgi:ABC-type Fe3+-hydroxamate transport system substrate-binding protein